MRSSFLMDLSSCAEEESARRLSALSESGSFGGAAAPDEARMTELLARMRFLAGCGWQGSCCLNDALFSSRPVQGREPLCEI